MKHYCKLFFLPLLLFFSSCKDAEETRGDEDDDVLEEVVNQASQRAINVNDIVVPEGYKIEAVKSGLTYPVDVTFDEKGNTYVAEAGGHTYGTKPARAPEARILKILPNNSVEVLYDKVVPMTEIKEEESSENMEEGLIPPVTGVTYYKGNLYISHRSRYSVYNLETDEFKTIVNGLPSWGEFLNAKPIFKDDKMYFFLSTQGNSGIQEEHWVNVIDMFNKPDVKEIPGEDVELTGLNFWVPTSKMTMTEADSLYTGIYVPLGTETEAGQVIQGQEICNGAFYMADLDGSNIERIAWGLRSSFGYRFSPDGRLITTMNSANPMPPRGIYYDYEPIYEVKQDEWYGWPDFYSGIPITDERFEYKDQKREFALTEKTHRKLLKGKERPIQPLAKLSSHSAIQGMVFGNGQMGVSEKDILVAEFGTIVPFFKGGEYHPHIPVKAVEEKNAPEGVEYDWPGFKVQRVDLSTGEARDFIYNKTGMPSSAPPAGGGLERPIQLEWDNEGNLYIVDFGVVEFDDTGMNAHPFTGIIWKVSKK